MIEPAQGWALKLFYRNSEGGFIAGPFCATRAQVIRRYDAVYSRPNAYARDRRKGEVIAVRVTMSETPT